MPCVCHKCCGDNKKCPAIIAMSASTSTNVGDLDNSLVLGNYANGGPNWGFTSQNLRLGQDLDVSATRVQPITRDAFQANVTSFTGGFKIEGPPVGGAVIQARLYVQNNPDTPNILKLIVEIPIIISSPGGTFSFSSEMDNLPLRNLPFPMAYNLTKFAFVLSQEPFVPHVNVQNFWAALTLQVFAPSIGFL